VQNRVGIRKLFDTTAIMDELDDIGSFLILFFYFGMNFGKMGLDNNLYSFFEQLCGTESKLA